MVGVVGVARVVVVVAVVGEVVGAAESVWVRLRVQLDRGCCTETAAQAHVAAEG